LSAFQPADAKRDETIERLLGSRLSDVLSQGLSCLPESNLRNLIRHPWLMLEHQERIFQDGSSYHEAAIREGSSRFFRSGGPFN
jgi:hypothetical protein